MCSILPDQPSSVHGFTALWRSPNTDQRGLLTPPGYHRLPVRRRTRAARVPCAWRPLSRDDPNSPRGSGGAPGDARTSSGTPWGCPPAGRRRRPRSRRTRPRPARCATPAGGDGAARPRRGRTPRPAAWPPTAHRTDRCASPCRPSPTVRRDDDAWLLLNATSCPPSAVLLYLPSPEILLTSRVTSATPVWRWG